MNELSVVKLTYQYAEADCFAPTSFTVRAGEGLVLRGDNGSGKTTLLQILAGLKQFYTGTFTWNQQSAPNLDYLTTTLYIGHKNALHEQLSAAEMIEYFAMLAGRQDTHQLNQLIDDFALRDLMPQGPRALSAGQKRKISLLRLGLIPSKVWLLDEPFSNLDQQASEVLVQLIQSHQQQGGITILSAHQALPLEFPLLELQT